jgi:hypothetical protein
MVLATLAAQSLTHQALATSDVKIVDPPQTKQRGDLVVSNSAKESITREETLKRASSAIASPESLTKQEFAPKATPSSASSSTQSVKDAQKVAVPSVDNPGPQESRSGIAPPEIAPPETDTRLRSKVEFNKGTQGYGDAKNLQIDSSLRLPPLNATSSEATPTPAQKNGSMSVESSAGMQAKPADSDDTGTRGTGDAGNSGLRPATPSSFGAASLTQKADAPSVATTSLTPTQKADAPDVANASLSPTLTTNISSLLRQPQSTPDDRTPSAAPQVATAKTLAGVQSHSAKDLLQVSTPQQTAGSRNTSTPQQTVTGQQTPAIVAQGTAITTTPCPDIDALLSQLRTLEDVKNADQFQASPSLSIVIPTGFGADRNTAFVSATFQERTRYGDVSDGGLGIGVGLGDARKSVGVELSYTIASFGGSRDFGAGGFNVKLHRQLSEGFAVAAGWNGFLNIGGDNDFENSVYGTVSKIFRTRDDINLPFSRVAVTAGIGSGQFRTESAIANNSGGVNVFGNIAVRVAQPVSLIAEWSGQDLGVGVSIAPFKNIPLVITPAVRDIAGAGDGPRFVLGTGFAYRF